VKIRSFDEILAEQEAAAAQKVEGQTPAQKRYTEKTAAQIAQDKGGIRSFDDILAEQEAVELPPAQPAKSRAVPLTPDRKAALQAKIDAGMIPLPGGLDTAKDAALDAFDEAGNQFGRKALFGIPGRVSAAVLGQPRRVDPIPDPSTQPGGKKWDDYVPDAVALNTGTGLGASAADMVAIGGAVGKAGETLGAIPGQVARRLGASEASTAVRPSLQTAANAGGAGAAFGASDAAIRGGDLVDVGEGAIQGAAGNVLMSQLPAVAQSIENSATNAVMHRATKPFLAIGQGKAANKAQLALGKGDKARGAQELQRVVQEEGLEPTVRKNPANIANVVQEKQEQVWEQELGPVRVLAMNAEPGARVPQSTAKKTLRALLKDEDAGTGRHEDIEKAISIMDKRAENLGTPGQWPLKNLLKNAQEFERDGYGKTEAKFSDGESARAIGKALRNLYDERISKIYMKRPELVMQALGRTPPEAQQKILETGELNPDYIPPRKPWQPMSEDEALSLGQLGDKYASARKRFADLKAIEPAAEQLASRMSQERPGLINSMQHGGRRLLGGIIGGHAGGAPGAILGAGLAEVAGRVVSPVQRASGAVASRLSGPAVDPKLAGAIVARYGQEALDAYTTFLANQTRKEMATAKKHGPSTVKGAR
jgi:hypothetical protein